MAGGRRIISGSREGACGFLLRVIRRFEGRLPATLLNKPGIELLQTIRTNAVRKDLLRMNENILFDFSPASLIITNFFADRADRK